MTKFVQPGNYTAKHTGKSGYFKPSAGKPGPPIPYSIVEEVSSNLYPSARDYIPKDFRSYTDSYYDLRNKQYKYWYDKWGKPHINKWWEKQLEYETLRQNWWKTKKTKNIRSTYSTFTKPIRQCSCNNHWSITRSRACTRACRRKHVSKQNWRRRQTNSYRQRSYYRSNYY